MIDTDGIRKRLLEMAIRGELTDSPQFGFLPKQFLKTIENIRQEKLNKKETKICDKSEMITDGIFEIPESWEWVALGDLCILLTRGKSPKYSEEKKVPVFAQKCNQPNRLALEKALFLDIETLNKWPGYLRLRNGDIVINSTGTGTMGRVGFFNDESIKNKFPYMLPDSHVTVARTAAVALSKYVFYVLRSDTLQSIMAKQFRGSTNQKELYINSVYALPIPLPPYEEQVKIVSIIDSAFSIINTIEKAQDDYKADQEALRKTIIDAGIQGKLTEQLLEDGTAEELYAQIQEEKSRLIAEGKIKKEKPLPPITEDEIPFEIPKNWKWVRFGDVMKNRDSERIPVSVADRKKLKKTYDYYGASGVIDKVEDYLFDGKLLLIGEDGANLLSRSTPIAFLAEGKYWVNNHAHVLDCYVHDYLDFVMFYINSISLVPYVTGAAQPKLNQENMNKIPVPLPPYEEQKRIVKRINAIILLL